jgi:uncharacterized membrane protein
MNDKVLTQELIDKGADEAVDESGRLYAKAMRHPIITGGLILVGAGLAYAAVRSFRKEADVAGDVHIETSIAIDRSPAELYAFWRDLKNLPLFMKNLVSVTEFDDRRSHWVAVGIGGSKVEWDAEVFNEQQDERIAWRSLEYADVVNAGSVRFQKGPEGHGTYVRVTVNYNPPAGFIGSALAQLLGAEPSQLIKEDLRRLKQLLEAGEIATVVGQTSGRSEGAEQVIQKRQEAALTTTA